jgi:PAS domain S-box-containing protein
VPIMDASKDNMDLLEQLEHYKKRNQKIKKKLKSLESILKESAIAIIIGNKKGEIIEANKKALKLSKYTHKEIRKLEVSKLLYRNNIPESFSRKELNEPSDEFASEQILLRKDGKKLFVSVKTKLLPDNNYQLVINDINKRKKAELRLIESEQRYRLLAENIHDVVWTATKWLKIKYISSSITKITGYSPDAYSVKPLHELVTPISYQLIRETFRQETEMLKTGTIASSKHTTTLEIKLVSKNLNNLWVELTATIVHNQFNEVIGFQGVLRNIDKEKKAREILAKREQRYDFAIKNTESGVWELDADLTGIKIDDNLLHLLGYDSNEIKPQLNEWINLTEKKDRITAIDVLQDLLDGKKVTMSYECRRIHKSGKTLWFSDYVEAIPDKEGDIIGLIGTSKNITREKINEEKKYRYYAGLQILTDSAFHLLKLPNLEGICDYAGKILLQNIPNSILIFTNIDSKSKHTKPNRFYGINEPKLHQLFENIDFTPYESSVLLPQKEYSLLDKKTLIEYNGGFPAFVNNIFPKEEADKIVKNFAFEKLHIIGFAPQGDLTGSLLIISREDTEIKNKEFIEAFINLVSIIINRKNIEDELKNINKTKDKFFSIISHDLKNPFNTFIGFSGLIMQNIDTISKEKILDFTKLIHDGAVHSYDMMQNLFDWVTAQKGGIVPKKNEIDLPGLINSIIKLFSSEASKKNIDLKLKKSTELKFLSDIDMLNTILRNLVSNALKFTEKNGRIEIHYFKTEDLLQFNVEDNGIGIPEEKQAIIFDANRYESTRGTSDEKGTGLGLSLCKEFIHILGGKIWVTSKEGKGSCFSFSIPL